MLSRHVKSVNTDSRSKKRIKFASTKERSKKASADVYRSHESQTGSAELVVHHPRWNDVRGTKNKRLLDDDNDDNKRSRSAFVKLSQKSVLIDDGKVHTESGKNGSNEIGTTTTFASELDIALDRNPSEIFSKFHRQIWILVRSLPEILHNLDTIIDLLLSYLLSPSKMLDRPSQMSTDGDSDIGGNAVTVRGVEIAGYIINHATADILHLLSVLARDLRHEIHPYLHTKILPRIAQDLLNPPPPPPDSNDQPIPLDVNIVETAFRTMSYIFRYDSNLIVENMESMRKYYGITLGNRRELIRRLSAESFAPLIRKIKNQNFRERHIRRVLRALAATTTQQSSRILARTQGDAVNGISHLLFQLIRGAAGRLHSQGCQILQFLLKYSCRENNLVNQSIDDNGDCNQDLVLSVTSGVLGKLCHHLGHSEFAKVFKELFSLFSSLVNTDVNRLNEKRADKGPIVLSFQPTIKCLKLIVEVATFRSGDLIKACNDNQVSVVCNSISKVCSEIYLVTMQIQDRCMFVSILCKMLLLLQDKQCIDIETIAESILGMKYEGLESMRSLLLIFVREFTPHLTDVSVKHKILSKVIIASARMTELDTNAALEVVFSAATSNNNTFHPDDGQYDQNCLFELFGKMPAIDFNITQKYQQLLLDACFCGFKNTKDDDEEKKDLYARLSLNIRCLPFIASLCSNHQTIIYKDSAKWLMRCFQSLQCGDLSDISVVKGLSIEAFSFLTLNASESSIDSSTIKKIASQVKALAGEFVLECSGSLWAVRGAASLIPVLEKFSLGPLVADTDTFFDSLIPNVRSANHFLRLYTLQLMASYPHKMFVVDHADLDLTDDLDEDASYSPNGQQKSIGVLAGPCDIISTLLKIESSPVKLKDEKQIISLIGKVEILGRTRKLPAIYAEVAANHMLGIYNVRFAPLWNSVEKTLVSLVTLYEDIVWPSFETKLLDVMIDGKTVATVENKPIRKNISSLKQEHFHSCHRWEDSGGKDISLFESTSELIIDGQIPCYHTTDMETVVESIWKAAEIGHRIVTRNSRKIVPVFFQFLHTQYFVSHSNDQDARELHLEEFVQMETSILERRLKCFLRFFAAIEGPQQLVHHKLLEKIFRSFLIHPDSYVVGCSLTFLVKFKVDYLTPHHKILREIVQKGKLKSSLLKLTEAIESETIDNESRQLLIPILARMLFGRVTAKVGGKSSKDSPAARRVAILSFMSVICKEEKDFFPFLYLMIRCFIPRTEKIQVIESYGSTNRSDLKDGLMRIRSANLTFLSSPVIEGFLHLLQSVLTQFGHKVIFWIPQLTHIIIEICKLAMITHEKPVSKKEDSILGTDEVTTSEHLRRSSIRTLCFQRLSNIFALFGSTVNFVPFSKSMWYALQPSLDMLPEMVIRNEGCPAILNLLQTMSANTDLIKLLSLHDQSVRAVIKCITGTTMMPVVQVTFTIIENLLTVEDENSAVTGKNLICKYTSLLMKQFTIRFNEKEKCDLPVTNNSSFKRHGKSAPTWRRELQILFCISNLVSAGNCEILSDDNAILGDLSEILIPFLQPDRGSLNEDKMHVIGILNGIIAKLEPQVALSIFWKVSPILAPYKARIGIETLSVRTSIASLIDKAAKKNPNLKPISAIVTKLSSVDKSLVDEIDFEVVVPELILLGCKDGLTWGDICTKSNSNPIFLTPLINICFDFLHVEDDVISRVSFNSLKSLVVVASSYIHQENGSTKAWLKLTESVIVPLSKAGLLCRDTKIRRYYILLIRELSINFHDISSSNVCGGLGILCNEENNDLDFFLGITHMQIHRRARAFQRLRTTLSQVKQDEQAKEKLSSQCVSNILLPLVLHPIYECKLKAEETFVLESIATLGAISRELSWSKYNNMMWVILSRFGRYPEQERYLVGALCAIIDGFDFELTRQSSTSSQPLMEKTSVWHSLVNRVIPKIESLLSKEITGRNGRREKIIQPAIILALVRLFKKFPGDFFETKLPTILAVICDALRSKDSNARDLARNTLAKMVCLVEMKYLGDVFRELAITLNEGYKLHVRAATVHSILLQLSSVHQPSLTNEESSLQFDNLTPAIIDLIQEDLFGVANERRESRDTNVRFVKEAVGNKSFHSIEMLCRMISFNPSKAINGKQTRSAVHCIVSPFIERLRLSSIDTKMIRKVKEALSRVTDGISNNESVTANLLFPFVYATIRPFMGGDNFDAVERSGQETEYDSDTGINVSGRENEDRDFSTVNSTHKSTANVVEWRPSTMKSSVSANSASIAKKNESHERRRVQDGASAPKLTGGSRHSKFGTFSTKAINEPGAITAIVFSLNLMNACLKRLDIRSGQCLRMLDPFVPMLTACVCYCRDTEVALAALKCLLVLLRADLPSIQSCSKVLGSKILTLLTTVGPSRHTNHDLMQACFKALTHLIGSETKNQVSEDFSNTAPKMVEKSERVITGSLLLNTEQMNVLIGFIQATITESDQHNPALNLIKVILKRQYVSSEFYVLMESMTRIIVRSPKATLRQQCGGIFVKYLLNYPMGQEKFEKHLKQVVANISYKYQEGRMSGILLLVSVMEKLPEELLQRHAQLLFLPLVLQLVNDDSKDCREKLSVCIITLLKRSSTVLLQIFQEYCLRWSQDTGPLRLASLHVFGYLIDSRADFIRASSIMPWVKHLEHNLQHCQEADWETSYFSLICVEKLMKDFEMILIQETNILEKVTECVVEPHPWIKLCSSRILNAFLISNCATSLLSKKDGMLFEIARNMSVNVAEEEQNEVLSKLTIKTLAFALPLMSENPQFCYAKNNLDSHNLDSDSMRDPVYWLIRRLTQIAKRKGNNRRITVYKCFAAFSSSNFHIVAPYLELMLEGLHRTITEAKNEIENQAFSQKRWPSVVTHTSSVSSGDNDIPVTELNLAEEVLKLMEDKCTSSNEFLTAYANVKRRALGKKKRRIVEQKTAKAFILEGTSIIQQQKRPIEKHVQERGGDENKKKHRIV